MSLGLAHWSEGGWASPVVCYTSCCWSILINQDHWFRSIYHDILAHQNQRIHYCDIGLHSLNPLHTQHEMMLKLTGNPNLSNNLSDLIQRWQFLFFYFDHPRIIHFDEIFSCVWPPLDLHTIYLRCAWVCVQLVLHCLVVIQYVNLDPGSPRLVKHDKAGLVQRYPIDASLTHQAHRWSIIECLSGIS